MFALSEWKVVLCPVPNVLWWCFVEKRNELRFLLKRMNCNSEEKIFLLFFSFQHLFNLFCVFFYVATFCWFFFVFCLYLENFVRLSSPFWFGREGETDTLKSRNNRQSRMKDENFSQSAQNMKNRLKFSIEEVKEKWYAQLLAAIYQIHCICSMCTQKRTR